MWLITCLLLVYSVLYCKLSASLSCKVVSSGVAGCSCLPDGPSPTPSQLHLHEVRFVRACFLTGMQGTHDKPKLFCKLCLAHHIVHAQKHVLKFRGQRVVDWRGKGARKAVSLKVEVRNIGLECERTKRVSREMCHRYGPDRCKVTWMKEKGVVSSVQKKARFGLEGG